MGKKQWYVCIEVSKNNLFIQYFDTKKDAEKCKSDINKKFIPYIDFVWKSDIDNKIPFSQLHGRLVTKTENIIKLCA